MSLFAVCTTFTCFYIGLALLPPDTELLPVVAVLLAVGPLAAIILSRCLLERKKSPERRWTAPPIRKMDANESCTGKLQPMLSLQTPSLSTVIHPVP